MNGEVKAKWIRVSWLAAALLPLLAGLAGAQQPVPHDTEKEHVPPTSGERVERTPMHEEHAGEFHAKLEKANELMGAKVVNAKGSRVGTIEDIVLTPDRRSVSYAVLAHGGFLGIGEKYFAVPWSEFEIKADENVLILDVEETDLEKAAGFDKDKWPTAADENWLGLTRDETPPEPGAVASAEGEDIKDADTRARGPGERTEARIERRDVPGAPAPGAGMRTDAKADIKYRRLSELIGTTVKNFQGEDLGELENIVLDIEEGRIAYAILSMRKGFLGMDKELAAVPWSSLDVLTELGTARLDTDKPTLEAIAFDEKDFPKLEDPQYSRDIHQRFGATPYWEPLGFVPGEGREGMEPRELSPWKEGSKYDALYNPGNVRTVQGTIESIGTFRLEGTSVPGLRLRIRTDDGQALTVHAGPRPYVLRQDVRFHYGDKVTVTGTPAKWGWRDVIVASQIKAGDKTLDLRTEDGKPRWNVNELEGPRESAR